MIGLEVEVNRIVAGLEVEVSRIVAEVSRIVAGLEVEVSRIVVGLEAGLVVGARLEEKTLVINTISTIITFNSVYFQS